MFLMMRKYKTLYSYTSPVGMISSESLRFRVFGLEGCLGSLAGDPPPLPAQAGFTDPLFWLTLWDAQ